MNTTEILLESKTARESQLIKVTHESAIDTLSKAKALVFALWQGTGAATTEQMADYYEVPAETVRTVFKRHRDELDSDGVKVLRGKALSAVRVIMNLTEFNRPHLTIWTPRAALRLGMLLRDSKIAQQVRTVLLDVAEKVADQEVQTESETIRELKLKIELAKLENRRRELDLCLVHRQPESDQLRRGKPDKLKILTSELVQKLLEFVERKGGSVTVREAQRKFNSKYRPNAQTVKGWFVELETLGYGKTATAGKSLCFTLRPQLTVVS